MAGFCEAGLAPACYSIGTMLVIRKAQMEAFAARQHTEFENGRVRDIEVRFRKRFGSLEEGGVRRLVQHGLRTARTFGIMAEDDVGTLIDLMLLLGDHFYDDPEFAFESEPLSDDSLPPDARLSLTVARLGLRLPLDEQKDTRVREAS